MELSSYIDRISNQVGQKIPGGSSASLNKVCLCIGYFEATKARSTKVNKHISPRCLKITYLHFHIVRLR
jgi:hypothetical protein